MRLKVLRLTAALFLIVMGTPSLKAEYLQFGYDIFVNMPASWQVHGVETDKFSAGNRAEEAFLLVKQPENGQFEDSRAMYTAFTNELAAQSYRQKSYPFSGHDATLGTVEFSQGGTKYRGYLLCVESHRTDLVGLAFADLDKIESYQDVLLSALDSIAIGENGLLEPGPVSQSVSPYPESEKEPYTIRFQGHEIPVAMSPSGMAVSQGLIEREAAVLSVYGGSRYAEAAWRRYYRLLYRDLFRRSRPLYAALRQYLSPEDLTERQVAEQLLEWVQGFQYERLDSLSDCLSPLTAAVENRGDCDSRGLLYTLMLHHYGIDAVLMVSSVYSHSMVGVDVEGQGARFPYQEKQYLVAETTDQVAIGRIDRSMSNADNWIGIDFFNSRLK